MSERRPTKTAKLVVQAIKHLKSKTGFTPWEIIKYIRTNNDVDEKTIKGVHTALKRGENYGFLRSHGGRYVLKESPTLSQLVARTRKHDDSDPDLKGLCKPRKRSGRRRSSRRRKGRSGKCSCGRRKRGSRRRRRSHRSRKGSRCGKRSRSRSQSRSRRRRGGKRKCSCGKRRRGGRRSRRSRRGGRSKCGGGRRRRGGRSRRRRSRRGGSRKRPSKCGC